MTSADTPILLAYTHPGSMGRIRCTLARSHTSLQHTKLTVDTVDVTGTDPTACKVIICLKALVSLQPFSCELSWRCDEVQHNVWEFQGRPSGNIVNPGLQGKFICVPSLSITYQGLSVGHIAAEKVSEMKDLVLFLVGFTYLRT